MRGHPRGVGFFGFMAIVNHTVNYLSSAERVAMGRRGSALHCAPLMQPDFTKLPYGFSEFRAPTLDGWQSAAGAVAPWTSPEGIAHRAVYTQADANVPHADGLPGLPPFLGGPYATMFAQKPWTIRQYAGFSTAEKTNEFYRAALAAGQQGLSVAF